MGVCRFLSTAWISASFEIKNKKPDRREFLRGSLEIKEGRVHGRKFERDGSGLISSLRQSDGLIEIPEDMTQVRQGDLVRFIPFASFG